MGNKYEILKDDSIQVYIGITLYRIRALKDFNDVKKGDLGGYIKKKYNLSQYGNCWVYDGAIVFGDASIHNNATVSGKSKVFGDANVYENAKIYDNAIVCGDSEIYGNAKIYGRAKVCDSSVHGNSEIFGNANVYENAIICDNARIFDYAEVCNGSKVYENAEVFGYSCVSFSANIGENAHISRSTDYAVVKGFGSKNRSTTFFKLKDGDIGVVCGCFYGTLDQFKKKVKLTHKRNGYAKEYLAIIKAIEAKFEIKRGNLLWRLLTRKIFR